MSSFFIGVDGGGTRSRAVLIGDDGKEEGRVLGPSAVASASDPEAGAQAVANICAAACRAVGRTLPADGVFAGLSGAGRERARSAVELVLGRMGVGTKIAVGTDVRAAFHDAFEDGPGVLLIAGTGSIAWGRAEDGQEGRVGGWGHHIGDEGSGYAMGKEALRRVARHADGRAPETNLQRRILERLGLERVDELVHWTQEATRGEIADLTPLVVETAEAGDEVAGEILVQAVEELEGHILTVLENLGPWHEPPAVVLAGGLLQPGGPLRAPLEALLVRHHIQPLDKEVDPALGAAHLAMALPGSAPLSL